jgi:hypothetical protein
MRKQPWEKPQLIVLVRPVPGDGIAVLQVCKTFTIDGPGNDGFCAIQDSEGCLGVAAS